MIKQDANNQKILDYIGMQTLAVLSTVAPGGRPEAAIVTFSNDGFFLYFGCLKSARKYQNLAANRHVAFVFGGKDNATVQYEGLAEELGGEEMERYKKLHISKYPDSAKFLDDPNERAFKVIPVWVRYYKGNPFEQFETEFNN